MGEEFNKFQAPDDQIASYVETLAFDLYLNHVCSLSVNYQPEDSILLYHTIFPSFFKISAGKCKSLFLKSSNLTSYWNCCQFSVTIAANFFASWKLKSFVGLW